MKKRIVGTLMALLLAATVLPPGAISVTSADVTSGLVTTAYAADEHNNSHPICGASCGHGSSSHSLPAGTTWTGVSSLDQIAKDGYYYLTEDVELSSAWSANYRYNGGTGYDNNVVLCLNGHDIGQIRSAAVISVSCGCTITITDCAAEGKQGEIKHAEDKDNNNIIHYHHGVYVTYGTFNMYGGCITGNTDGYVENNRAYAGEGGGVYVGDGYSNSSSAVFNMYGGTITGNKADQGGAGGGVYVESGRTFNMYGGTISGNTADYGGGVYVEEGATFTMSGDANITANTAGTTTRGFGGGVYSKGTFNLNGGTITENTAISDDFTGELGGGVNSAGGKLNLSGNPVVKDNKKDASSDNVKVDGGTMEVTAALTEGAEIVLNSLNGATITPTDKKDVWYTWDEATKTLTAGTGGSGGETTVPVESVSLNKQTLRMGVNDTKELFATVMPYNATDKTVTWSSSNTAVATVENGVVEAVSAGTATITATAGGKSATCEVTVSTTYVEATEVLLSQDTAEIKVGETVQLTATVKPDNATNKTVTWSSSDAEIATVDTNGLVTGLKTGEVSIFAMTADDRGKTCEVKVTAAQTGETKYALTVNNGTGSGEYAEGEVVTITANTAAQGMMFYRWEGADGLEFVGDTAANEPTAKFKMPNHAVTLTAAYIPQGVIDIVITPNGGEFTDSVQVTLAPTRQLVLSDLKLYYTTDGTEAYSSETRKVYTEPFTLTETCTVNVALYTVSKEDSSERIYTTKSATFTKVGGGESGGDTPTPTPTPEAPRYYYSSGSGSTGAGGLSAVQNDPNGKSATDYSGGIYGLLFRTNAASGALRGVQVDGVTIGAANYSVEGNEVYLKAVYLQTLANGKHTLTVLSDGGDMTAAFTVGGEVSAPKTADAGALVYLGLALSSYTGTALVMRRKKEF